MADPPALAGAVQLTLTDWLPTVPVTAVGASGGPEEYEIEM
jgi:hypothetical protein